MIMIMVVMIMVIMIMIMMMMIMMAIIQATFQTAGTKYEEELNAATNTTTYKKVLAYR